MIVLCRFIEKIVIFCWRYSLFCMGKYFYDIMSKVISRCHYCHNLLLETRISKNVTKTLRDVILLSLSHIIVKEHNNDILTSIKFARWQRYYS